MQETRQSSSLREKVTVIAYQFINLVFSLSEMLSSDRDVWSHSSISSDTRTYSPGPPLTPMELRKMSLLSSISVTIPLDQDFSVRAVSPTGCLLSPEHILPNPGN